MMQLDVSTGASQPNRVHEVNGVQQSAVLHRHLHHDFLNVARGEGHYLFLEDGRKIFDASGGAAVACIGVGDFILADLDSISQKLSPVWPHRPPMNAC